MTREVEREGRRMTRRMVRVARCLSNNFITARMCGRVCLTLLDCSDIYLWLTKGGGRCVGIKINLYITNIDIQHKYCIQHKCCIYRRSWKYFNHWGNFYLDHHIFPSPWWRLAGFTWLVNCLMDSHIWHSCPRSDSNIISQLVVSSIQGKLSIVRIGRIHFIFRSFLTPEPEPCSIWEEIYFSINIVLKYSY